METSAKVTNTKALYANHSHSIAEICKSVAVSRATLHRNLDVSTVPAHEPAEHWEEMRHN